MLKLLNQLFNDPKLLENRLLRSGFNLFYIVKNENEQRVSFFSLCIES